MYSLTQLSTKWYSSETVNITLAFAQRQSRGYIMPREYIVEVYILGLYERNIYHHSNLELGT